MKKLISTILLLTVGVIAGVSIDHYLSSSQNETINGDETAIEHAKKHLDPNYVCPMHSQIVSGEQGTCPICGMDLVKIKTSDSKLNDDDDPYPSVQVSSTMINNMGVRVAQVERKTLVRQIETPGFITQVRKKSFTRYRAPAKGRVVKFHFKPGQWQEPGDPLIDIALDDLVLVQEKHLELLAKELEQKESQEAKFIEGGLKEAKLKEALPKDAKPMADAVDASINDGSVNDTTAEKLNAEKPNDEPTIDEPTIESAEIASEKETTEPTIEKTRFLMKIAGMTDEQITELEETKVTSPIITLYAKHAGEVELLSVDVDEEVKANKMLFALGGLMRVTVLANAFQRDASWIQPGQEVDIILPHDSNKPYKGRVSNGAVSININSQNIGIELVFYAPHSIVKSGMYVVGNIYSQVKKDTLTLPREAVIYSHGEKRVIVAMGEGRFKPVVVDIGISNDNEVEILDGLEEGDTVVVSAQFLIDSESSLQASYRRMTSVE